MRGEWIEMVMKYIIAREILSLPMLGEWIEIYKMQSRLQKDWSLPMRGEWIEIFFTVFVNPPEPVSPHAGRVD